jgi:hypothetical protein
VHERIGVDDQGADLPTELEHDELGVGAGGVVLTPGVSAAVTVRIALGATGCRRVIMVVSMLVVRSSVLAG